MQWVADKLPEIIIAFPSLNVSLFCYFLSRISKRKRLLLIVHSHIPSPGFLEDNQLSN